MTTYKVSVDIDALKDIQDATDWYNEQLQGLGSRFQKQTKLQINSLKKEATLYTNRYAAVCLLKNFPDQLYHN